MKENRKIYILIHGAWHAAWCWNKITQPLLSAGHQVVTPDLPGHGSQWRASRTVTFNDYVMSIMEIIKQQPEPVTLVGHSMAGLIISRVAELMPAHINELIYVCAYIPENQQSLLSIAESSSSRGVSPFLIIDQANREIRLKKEPGLVDVFFNACHQEDIDFALSQLQAQPLQPFAEQVQLGKNFDSVRKSSIICDLDKAIIQSDQLRYSHKVTDNITHFPADHSPYYSATDKLISYLLTH